ncbi:MAG: hypothetical protein U1A78_13780 [Polyangia bacterium]
MTARTPAEHWVCCVLAAGLQLAFRRCSRARRLAAAPFPARGPWRRGRCAAAGNARARVCDGGLTLRWNGDSLYWFSALSGKSLTPLRTEVQNSLEITDVWVEPGTRDVSMISWNAATSSLYFGFGSPDEDSVQFINPTEEAGSGLDPAGTKDCKGAAAAMFVPRKPLSIACSRANSGDCWVSGEKNLLLFHGPRNPIQNYRDCSNSLVFSPPGPALRALHVLTDASNYEKYDYVGVGDGGAFFTGGRDPVLAMPPLNLPPYIGPVVPGGMRPAVPFTAATMTKPGVALVGGAGGYVGRIANPGTGYVATPIALGTTDDVSDLTVVRDHLLVTTKGGQLFDLAVP